MVVQENIDGDEEINEQFSKAKTLKNKFPSKAEEREKIQKFHTKFNNKTTQHRRRVLIA